MVKLSHMFELIIKPLPPFSFELTVHKPAGWSLFTPFETYEGGVLWTASSLSGVLAGIRLSSSGNVNSPCVGVRVYTESALELEDQEEFRRIITRVLGAEQELSEFYEIASRDDILKHAVDDLYGMHDTYSASVFPEAVLAILLQMAPLKRSNEMMASFIHNYGEVAEFDNVSVLAWPEESRIFGLDENELASKCKVGYRAKNIIKLARMLVETDFPSMDRIIEMEPEEAKKQLRNLPGIGDYSADIINPHGGFPIDVWSAEVFGKLFFGEKPENNRKAVERVKKEGLKRWGKWSWLAFFYIVQDIPNLSAKLGMDLRIT